MAKVEIIESLKKEILKKFKSESTIIFKLMKSLGDNPHKGKPLGHAGRFTIKELKYKKFRFYFIIDRSNINILSREELIDLLLKFVRMSEKKNQQKVINEIRNILIKLGPHGF
jgi:hypothetical protein